MVGVLGSLLRERYGEPRIVAGATFVEYRWNDEVETLRCILYKNPDLDEKRDLPLGVLRGCYGDFVGGSLLRGALKVATLQKQKSMVFTKSRSCKLFPRFVMPTPSTLAFASSWIQQTFGSMESKEASSIATIRRQGNWTHWAPYSQRWESC